MQGWRAPSPASRLLQVCGVSGARFHRPTILSHPHRPGFHAAVLLDTGGIESPADLGAELAVTDKMRHAAALGLRTAETEFPILAVALGDLLLATRLRIGQRNRLGRHLLRRQAYPYALPTEVEIGRAS